jgi:WD40 repeat protein
MWDAFTGEEGADLDLETRFGNHVGTRFTPNGRFLLIEQLNFDGGPDHLQFWDVEARKVRGSIEGAFWSVAFAADGKTVATYTRDRASDGVKIGVWQLGEGDPHATPLRRHDVPADQVAFTPTLETFAVTTRSGDDAGPQDVQVRDMATGAVIARARYEDTETHIQRLSFGNDGRFLVATAGGGTQLDWKWKITAWDTGTGLVIAHTFLDDSHVEVSPDGKWVALPNETGVEVVETITGASHGTYHRAGDADWSWNSSYNSSRLSSGRVAFAPDSRTMVVTGFHHRGTPSLLDKWVPAQFDVLRGKMGGSVARLWAVESGRELAAFPGCPSAQFSPDGRLLATRHEDDIRIWKPPPRKPLAPSLVGASLFWLALFAGVRMVRWRLARPRVRTAV